jgi:DNA-binding XRE family transcriptional regulator
MNHKLLRAIRKSGWLMEELAALAQVPEPVLYRICTGRTDPDQNTQYRLAQVLDCQISEIFEGADNA